MSPTQVWYYNQRANMEAERCRNYVMLHNSMNPTKDPAVGEDIDLKLAAGGILPLNCKR